MEESVKRWSSIALGVSWFVITLTAAASEWATWPAKKIPTWDPVNETYSLVPMTWRWYATHDLVWAAAWLLGLWLLIGVVYLVGRRGARIGFGVVSLATLLSVMVGTPYQRLEVNPLASSVLSYPSMINGRNALVLGAVWVVVLLLPGLLALASVPARRTSQAEIEAVALLAAIQVGAAWGAALSLADVVGLGAMLGPYFVAGAVGAIRGRMWILVVGAIVALAVLQGEILLALVPLLAVAAGSLVPRLAGIITRMGRALTTVRSSATIGS